MLSFIKGAYGDSNVLMICEVQGVDLTPVGPCLMKFKE